MLSTSNRSALQFYSITIAACLCLPLYDALIPPKYNLIHCQKDLWCFQANRDYNGTKRAVCEGIDPIMPNYRERGLLQINNYARLFATEWQAEYGRTFSTRCFATPIHPLWEERGATEEAHFLSVSTRDCSEGVYSHNTCHDYCYNDENESRDTFKPFDLCKPKPRKEMFQMKASKETSYREKTGGKKIQFNAEAKCGANWPCTDAGHCGAVFKQTRWFTGIGRALGTIDKPNPSSYFKGTRTYDFLPTFELTNEIKFWKRYGDTSVLHRIPSGSHYDKCILDNNCKSVGEFQNIYFQFTYSHYEILSNDDTAKVYIDGTPHHMALKHSNSSAGQGQNWAIFESTFNNTDVPYPNTCKSYYFEIEDENGVIVRLPEDEQYNFATTGNGCNLNHFYTDIDGTWNNCKGEHAATNTPTLAATNPPMLAATNPPTLAATNPPTLATTNPTTLPPTNPATLPPMSPVMASQISSPGTNTGCYTIIESIPEFTNNDGTWENFKSETFGDHVILGRYDRSGEANNEFPSKQFEVSQNAAEVEITFDLHEIDEWEKKDVGTVVINEDQVAPLGVLQSDDVKDEYRYSFEGDSTTNIMLTREADGPPVRIGGNKNKKDQVHHVTVIIPKNHFEATGKFIFEIRVKFDQNINNESFGLNNFTVRTRSDVC